MLASETQNADYLQGDDARWNHKEIERLRGYTLYIYIYIYIYMHVYMREMGDRARLCEPGFCDARDLVGGCECMKDASILVTSLLPFQFGGFAPQIFVS